MRSYTLRSFVEVDTGTKKIPTWLKAISVKFRSKFAALHKSSQRDIKKNTKQTNELLIGAPGNWGKNCSLLRSWRLERPPPPSSSRSLIKTDQKLTKSRAKPGPSLITVWNLMHYHRYIFDRGSINKLSSSQ